MEELKNKIANFKEMYDRAFHYGNLKASINNHSIPEQYALGIDERGIDLMYNGNSRGNWDESEWVSWDELEMPEETFAKHCTDEKLKREENEKKEIKKREQQKEENERKEYERLKNKFEN